MRILRFLLTMLSIFGAVLAGNWIGNALHVLITGELGPQMRLSHTNAQGEMVIGANVVITNFVPALLTAAIGKPRWLYALSAGVIASALLGDRFEQRVGIAPATARRILSTQHHFATQS
jgi:hypothetical protein